MYQANPAISLDGPIAPATPTAPVGMMGRPKKKNKLRNIVGIIGDALDPSGSMLYTQSKMQERERQAQLEQYQRQLNDQWSMFERKQEYERANPTPAAPTTFQRDYEYILQTQGPEAAETFLRNKINPLQGVRVTNPDGSEGIQFIRPGGVGGAEMPPEVLDEIPDEGGPSLTSSGGFRPGF